MAKICMSCGAMNNVESGFCNRCGKKLNVSIVSTQKRPSPWVDEKKQRISDDDSGNSDSHKYFSNVVPGRFKKFIIPGCLAVGVIVVIVFILIATSKPKFIGTWKLKLKNGSEVTRTETLTFDSDGQMFKDDTFYANYTYTDRVFSCERDNIKFSIEYEFEGGDLIVYSKNGNPWLYERID